MPRTAKLVLNIDVDGEQFPITFTQLDRVLNRIGKRVVSNARKVLKKQKKVVSGYLSKSLYYEIEGSKESVELTFEAQAPYWDFVEQGVQGLISNKKAPNSPFKFGSGKTQLTKGTLRGGIDKWVIQKPIPGVRGANGRFIPRKQMVSAISTQVYNYGIAPSNYYAIALDQGYKKGKRLIAKAIGTDVSNFIEENMAGTYFITITI